MSDSELWSVAIAPNNVQTMTLDQLDDAFQRGLISDNAMVWTEGMESWLRLREVLGEEAAEAEAAPVAAAPVAAAPTFAPAQQAFAPAQQAFAPAQQAFAPAQQAFAQSRAPQPMATMPSAPTASAPMSLPPPSTAPVAMNLSDDLEMSNFGGSKKSKWGYFLAAAIVVGGVGLSVAVSSGGSAIDPGKATAAAGVPVSPVSPGDEPLNIPVKPSDDAPLTAGGYKVSAAEEAKFKAEAEAEAEQRAKVAAALAAKPAEEAAPAKPKRRGGGGGKARNNAAAASSPIKKGGSKFDPLNGALP